MDFDPDMEDADQQPRRQFNQMARIVDSSARRPASSGSRSVAKLAKAKAKAKAQSKSKAKAKAKAKDQSKSKAKAKAKVVRCGSKTQFDLTLELLSVLGPSSARSSNCRNLAFNFS